MSLLAGNLGRMMYLHKFKDCLQKWYHPKVSGPYSAGLVEKGATLNDTVGRFEETGQEICRTRTFPNLI